MQKEKIIGIALMILSAIGFVAMSFAPVITTAHHQKVISGITIEEMSWKGKNSQYDCDITIPQIQGYATADIAGLNAEILAMAKKFVETAIPENTKDKDPQSAPYEYNISYRISSGMTNIVDITLSTYLYTGGIHGMTFEETYHIETTTGKELMFNDIFIPGAREYFENQISAQMKKDPETYFDDAKPEVADTQDVRFYFTGDEVVFVFGAYSIAPYSSGMPEFHFKKDDIKKWLKNL